LSNLDYSFYKTVKHEDIVAAKIQCSEILYVASHMVLGHQTGLNWDYPGVTFAKRIKDNKAYQLTIPMKDLDNTIAGLQAIRAKNAAFCDSLLEN